MTITETVKKLAQVHCTGGAPELFYEVPSGVQAVVKNIHILNLIAGTTSAFGLWQGEVDNDHIIFPGLAYLQPGEFAMFDGNITMSGLDRLYIAADTGSIVATAHGIEFS